MARGPGLSEDMKARISELRSLNWSPNRIHAKHPEVKLSTIKSFIAREARRARNPTPPKPRGAKRKLTDEDRDRIYDIINHENPNIKHKDLLLEIDNKIKIKSLRNLLKELDRLSCGRQYFKMDNNLVASAALGATSISSSSKLELKPF